MSYKIVVQKIEQVSVAKRGDHTIIDKKYLNAQEFNDLAYQDQQYYKKIVTDEHGTEQYIREIYGYAPNWNGFNEVDVKIYEQVVEELDMMGLVAVVNQIQGLAKA